MAAPPGNAAEVAKRFAMAGDAGASPPEPHPLNQGIGWSYLRYTIGGGRRG